MSVRTLRIFLGLETPKTSAEQSLSPTCEICDTPELCLTGRCPCDLCGEFIADVPREVANKLLESNHRLQPEEPSAILP
jgi:uncharacterized Zn finger protein (UPF0148 family)